MSLASGSYGHVTSKRFRCFYHATYLAETADAVLGPGPASCSLFLRGPCLLKISRELWELFSGQGRHFYSDYFVESPSCLRVEAPVPTAFLGAVSPGSRLCLRRADRPVGENRILSGLQALVWRGAVPSLIHLAVPQVGRLGGVILSDPSQIYS